jgi:xanthine dehydrogenase molybdenum-binding subunit
MSQQPNVPGGTGAMTPLTIIGRSTIRIDALERVTGRARYTGDVQLPGMLYARVLRSPHAHARIRSIDVSKARAVHGVKAIVTHENCTVVWGAGSIAGGAQYNDEIKKNTRQRRYAFNNPVRFVGDPVAAVAATSRHLAEDAMHLIVVDYEILPHVLDHEEALAPGAPSIWPEGKIVPIPATGPAHRASAATSIRRSPPRIASSKIDSTAFVHNAQMARARRWLSGRR